MRTAGARAGLAALVAVGALLAAIPGSAAAVPPFDLPGELVDEHEVLADPAAVERGQDALFAETNRQLFVVVVDDLDGLDGPTWLEQTARLSGLGEEDLALVVAVGVDQAGPSTAALRVPEDAGMRPGAVTRVERDVQVAAERGDADEVVAAALTGLRAAGIDRPGEATSRAIWWVAVLVLVLAVAGTVALWLFTRARQARQEALDRLRADELSGTLGTLVVDLDEALREIRLELDLAQARVDDDEAAQLLEQAEEQTQLARDEAVQVHRRRSELSLGPTSDLTWRVTPGEAVRELEELHTLARSARERLRGLTLPD